MPDLVIGEWRRGTDPFTNLDALASVLHASVHAGASVSFILPFSLDDARVFWRDHVIPRVEAGSRRLLVACLADRIVGTVQLDLATPPN